AADRPRLSVWIVTTGAVNSGSVSAGAEFNRATPNTTTPAATSTTSSRNLSAMRMTAPITLPTLLRLPFLPQLISGANRAPGRAEHTRVRRPGLEHFATFFAGQKQAATAVRRRRRPPPG